MAIMAITRIPNSTLPPKLVGALGVGVGALLVVVEPTSTELRLVSSELMLGRMVETLVSTEGLLVVLSIAVVVEATTPDVMGIPTVGVPVGVADTVGRGPTGTTVPVEVITVVSWARVGTGVAVVTSAVPIVTVVTGLEAEKDEIQYAGVTVTVTVIATVSEVS